MRAHLLVGVAVAITLVAAVAVGQQPVDTPTPTPTPAPTSTQTLTPAPTQTPALTPTPTQTLTPDPTQTLTPAPTGTPEVKDDPAPERLAAIIHVAAATEQRGRIVDAVLGLLLAGGTITSGALLVTLPSRDSLGNEINTPAKALGGIAIGFGVLSVLSGGLGLFSRGPLERLDDAYGPIARDRTIASADRLAQGENALRQMAEGGRRGRIFGGILSIVLGAGLGIAAIPIVVSAKVDGVDNTSTQVYLSLALGISSFASIASGVTAIVVRRTDAEQLWSMWLAGTGRSQEARPLLQPFVTPVMGGVVSGVGGRF
jgi:hypothetical protein